MKEPSQNLKVIYIEQKHKLSTYDLLIDKLLENLKAKNQLFRMQASKESKASFNLKLNQIEEQIRQNLFHCKILLFRSLTFGLNKIKISNIQKQIYLAMQLFTLEKTQFRIFCTLGLISVLIKFLLKLESSIKFFFFNKGKNGTCFCRIQVNQSQCLFRGSSQIKYRTKNG